MTYFFIQKKQKKRVPKKNKTKKKQEQCGSIFHPPLTWQTITITDTPIASPSGLCHSKASCSAFVQHYLSKSSSKLGLHSRNKKSESQFKLLFAGQSLEWMGGIVFLHYFNELP